MNKINWWTIRDYWENLKPFSAFIGGRGIGKTYSTIDALEDPELMQGKKFIYLRNTDKQIKTCASAFGNPFKKWNTDHNRHIEIESEGEHYNIIEKIYTENNKGKKVLDHVDFFGYAVGLSTFENLRGVDLSDVDYVLFDEFIEKKRLKFNQAETFMSFYETVNRNRELLGEEPLKVIMLSNAQKLDNPILVYLNFVTVIENMIRNDKHTTRGKNFMICLPESEVSEQKKETVLYQMIEGTAYYDQAISNQFSNDSFYGVKKCKIVEYVPVCKIDELYIYRHKSTGKMYITFTRAANVPEFSSTDQRLLFMKAYGLNIVGMYAVGKVNFENFTVKSKMLEIINY